MRAPPLAPLPAPARAKAARRAQDHSGSSPRSNVAPSRTMPLHRPRSHDAAPQTAHDAAPQTALARCRARARALTAARLTAANPPAAASWPGGAVEKRCGSSTNAVPSAALAIEPIGSSSSSMKKASTFPPPERSAPKATPKGRKSRSSCARGGGRGGRLWRPDGGGGGRWQGERGMAVATHWSHSP